MSSVFISYSSKDRGFAEHLAADLKSKGISVWYDQWELKIGDSLVDKINAGIKSQDYVLVVLSQASIKSAWVTKELNAGFIKELQQKRIVLLPVIIEDCLLPPLLVDRVYADFRGDYLIGLNNLMEKFPGNAFVSGINLRERKELAPNVRVDNVINTNVLDITLK